MSETIPEKENVREYNKAIDKQKNNSKFDETLLNAKKNPEKYQNLIVRVWGFSAYFNDLSEEYKDLLIERALKNEGKIDS